MAAAATSAGTLGCMDPTVAPNSYYGLTELECHSQPGCSKDLIENRYSQDPKRAFLNNLLFGMSVAQMCCRLLHYKCQHSNTGN